MKMFVALPSAVLLCLTGCAGSKLVGRPDLQVVSGTALPAPATIDLIQPERPYLIGPLDKVAIDVYGMPELSRSVQVDASGRIAIPLLGSLQASGKTPLELGDLITQQLRGRYVREPRVTINLTETLSQNVTIDGAVTKPGQYAIAGRETLMRAVARAEGTTEFAEENHVVVFRRVNNRDMAALYDLRAIRQGMYADPEIYANDVIQVGDSAARRIFRDSISLSPILSAPLLAILN
jgi:polysaccharide export outer membrane protein